MSSKKSWHWGTAQEESFLKIKLELTTPSVPSLYDPAAPTKVSADASSYGLGAVLLQESNATWRPVAYASRLLSATETRYAQIEKEALAVTWARSKFSNYILGRPFLIETDHKPLIPILSTKHLDDLPPRVLRFRLRLTRFSYSITYVPGKLLYTADTLSRAPQPTQDAELQEEAESFVEAITKALPVSDRQLDVYQQAQSEDRICRSIAYLDGHSSLQLTTLWDLTGR